MLAVLGELDTPDAEHPDASLTHESGWSLSAFQSGRLVWENVEEGEPRHMLGVSRERTLHLWLLLARGDLATIEGEAWLAGYG
jgi:hypothetical protein